MTSGPGLLLNRHDPARAGDAPRRKGRRLVLALPAVALAAAFAGFATFVVSLDRFETEPAAAADGIVALTGGSGRVEDAIDLLARGFAGRLLITGVNERTTRDTIARLSPGQRDLVACCVDLDYRARNTAGNAAEISRWAREKGFRSLIVVTSDYHLPRAMAELDAVLPDIRKIPYPVVPARPGDDLSAAWGRARVLLSEYVKFVLVSVRTRLAGRRTGPARTGGPHRDTDLAERRPAG